MSEVCYQVDDIFFGSLSEVLFLRMNNPLEKCFIYLISPWIHDLTASENYLESIISNLSQLPLGDFAELKNVSSILGFLKTKISHPENIDIKIVTSEYNLRSMKKDNLYQNRREKIFLKKILKTNGEVYLHPDLHSKMIITPGKILDGSANITYPGFFTHTENVSLYYSVDNIFQAKLERAHNIIKEAQSHKSLKEVKQDFEQI